MIAIASPDAGAAPQEMPRASWRLRIAVIPERYGRVMSPCSSIRLFSFTERFPADVRYLLPEEIEAFDPHVVIWNRTALASIRDVEFVERARGSGATLVYDLDDNLLAMEHHPERDSYKGLLDSVRQSLALADIVWCSTRRLADAISGETAAVAWLPNALDPALWQSSEMAAGATEKSANAPLRLLYMGTRTHDEDFGLLDEALTKLEAERPGSFRLTLVGVNAKGVHQRPWLDVLSPPSHVGASYPAFVHWFARHRGFDLGVAPLIDNDFNRAKSSIKVLDYAAIGLATLASRVPAYMDDASGDRLLVENSAEAWCGAIAHLMDHPDELSSLAENARRLVGPLPFEKAVSDRWENLLELRGGA